MTQRGSDMIHISSFPTKTCILKRLCTNIPSTALADASDADSRATDWERGLKSHLSTASVYIQEREASPVASWWEHSTRRQCQRVILWSIRVRCFRIVEAAMLPPPGPCTCSYEGDRSMVPQPRELHRPLNSSLLLPTAKDREINVVGTGSCFLFQAWGSPHGCGLVCFHLSPISGKTVHSRRTCLRHCTPTASHHYLG